MTNYKNRGQFLERVINISNKQYLERNLALIQKVPTPTTGNKKKGTFHYTEKSTVDFIGVANGKFIAFDTKETKNINFPFNRLQSHQESYLKHAQEQKGVAFILILFTEVNELYRLSIEEYEQLKSELKRKSIPLQWFRDNKKDIKSKNGVYYDYLNITETN